MHAFSVFSLTVYNFYDFFKTPKLMEHLGKKVYLVIM